MEQENRRVIPEDEIDLRSIGSKIFSYLSYPFSLLLSNKLIASIFIIVALLTSVVIKYTTPKMYTASFIIRSNDIKDKIYLKILNEVPSLLRKGDKKALSSMLELDSLTLSKLAKVTVNPSDIKNSGDSTHTVDVELLTSDTKILLPVQNALINYLENNPYYQRIKNLQKEQLEVNQAHNDRELAQLDSLKKRQLNQYGKQKELPQGSVILNELMNPVAAYYASSERIEKKTSLMAQRVFMDRFMLIKGCVIPTQYSWPPRILALSLYTVPFFLILCAVFLHYRRKRMNI